MFQNTSRWITLVLHAGKLIHEATDFWEVVEDLSELGLLVRTEYQTVELETLIEAAADAFGMPIEDYIV